MTPPSTAPATAPAPVPIPGRTDPATAPAPAPMAAPVASLAIMWSVAGLVAQPPSARLLTAAAEIRRRFIRLSSRSCPAPQRFQCVCAGFVPEALLTGHEPCRKRNGTELLKQTQFDEAEASSRLA